MNFKETLAKCRELGWNEDLIREFLWNEAYTLGRKRWYWGPRWFVNLQGWFNSRRHRRLKY